ncbi:cobalamin biosynthesis protein CobW [Marinobacterium nitratireducens]|uniref:Cobalamin biosynthesis protein CobW n=1 Tax=Marinobacterium nitratireducens TaxID=518897 RepID=A0A917ZP01_9GAMM|nr:GTP-binding protein [Marinobacterium nitratireducens]GGO87504.1 cobalamin biosynthesis protein CobW [Marinobacterium nitratireducens]
MPNRIPVNIITGFLGVGKTTAINALLKQKPESERWAVLVNEFGQIGVDQAAMADSDDVQIKELAGGCICCALGPMLRAGLATLIRTAKPDRLIIEPTGLGHPEGIIDTLQGDSFRDVLDLRAVICLLDPRLLDDPRVTGHETFQDQLNLADIVLLNKLDLASPDQVGQAQSGLAGLFPPKQLVATAEQGRFDSALLDLVRNDTLAAQFPGSHDAFDSPAPAQNLMLPEPGKPVRRTGAGADFVSCGWVFHRDDVFDYDRLEACLNGLDGAVRIKGAFRIGYVWLFYNRALDDASIDKLAWRRDSRLEIISRDARDWDAIEALLLDCLEGDSQQSPTGAD